MRCIDKDAALEAINDAPQFQNPTITKFDVAMFLNSRPTVVLERGDTIDRQAVLAMLDDIENEVMDGEGYQYGKWSEYVEHLPSTQPDLSEYSDKLWRAAYERGKAEAQRMPGRWIDRNGNIVAPFWERYECSECGARSDNTNYCPNCGAKMENGGGTK